MKAHFSLYFLFLRKKEKEIGYEIYDYVYKKKSNGSPNPLSLLTSSRLFFHSKCLSLVWFFVLLSHLSMQLLKELSY